MKRLAPRPVAPALRRDSAPPRRRIATRAVAVTLGMAALGAACSNQAGGARPDGAAAAPAFTGQVAKADPTGAPGFAPSSPAAGAGDASKCPRPQGFTKSSVTVGLQRSFAGGSVVQFGLPVPSGSLKDAGSLRVAANGKGVEAKVRPLLDDLDDKGSRKGVRSVLVELPDSVVQGDCGQVQISWDGGDGDPVKVADNDSTPFGDVSSESKEVVQTAKRTIVEKDGKATLEQTSTDDRVLYTAREPSVMATFPDGYLAATGILGRQVSATQVPDQLAGLKFVSEQATPFGLSGMFAPGYAVNPDAVVGPDDLDEKKDITGYEAWLYDRCATYLIFTSQTGDTRFQREAMRVCSYYAGKIELQGENRGTFKGKPEPDAKYSHLRGLYAYYALTGDPSALDAGKAIAEMWLHEDNFVAPYRAGHVRGPDKQWTERLLGTSIEGMYYGQLLTGDRQYLDAVKEMVGTAQRHISGDASVLAEINPGATVFPPQNCFIHTAEQHGEGEANEPWCSGWMPDLMVDSLLAYQDQTGDSRVDDIFIRLTRFLRDTGSAYFKGDLLKDDFLHPSVAYDPNVEAVQDRRLLVPLYGAGIDASGKRQNYGDYDDTNHCMDATSLTAAGLRALRRSEGFDKNPVGPFTSEGESFVALHGELAFCAYATFQDQTRGGRNPANVKPEKLQDGLSDPAKYIEDNKIGFPTGNVYPQRKLSWWFNSAFEQIPLLQEAGVAMPELHPGAIQP